MVHLGLGGQFLQEGDSAYLFPVNQADVETQTRKIVSFLVLSFMSYIRIESNVIQFENTEAERIINFHENLHEIGLQSLEM